MSAPPEVTVEDLNGTWVMDKTLSNDPDSVFKLQGLSWITRTAISLATITLHATEYKDGDLVRIDIAQTVTGGLQGTTEHRKLDWSVNDHTDHIFGSVKGQSRFLKGAADPDGKVRPNVDIQTKIGGDGVEDTAIATFLRGETLANGEPTEGFLEEENSVFVQSWVRSVDNGWTGEQIWGFENVDGVRHYTRRVVVAKDGMTEKVRLVYNFLGRQE